MSEDKQERDVTIEISDQQEEYKEWLAFAKIDYESAKYLNGAPFHPRPLNVICYHCQQAAEKAAKALIVYFGSQGGMPKLHDIQFLLGQVRNLVKERKGIVIEESLMDIAESLSKYGVAPRYPNEIEVDEEKTKKALKDADTLLSWVISVIDAKDMPSAAD
ncbi:MAG: HEPN domain-containing protein [Oscillospiraceae bacterium]|nr:HEPN domain-containing protein [Oscillospiraceae bacterium]